jgi:hypothetical protein
MTVNATQQFMGANKARFELKSESINSLFVSDGMQMATSEAGRVQASKRADPKLNEGLPGAIARGGFMLPRLVARREEGSFDADKTLLVSAFKKGVTERIGKVEAQCVEYTIKFGASSTGPAEMVNVSVWIDPQALVPLKRKVHIGNGEADFFVEQYKEFAIDPKFDARVFELPR